MDGYAIRDKNTSMHTIIHTYIHKTKYTYTVITHSELKKQKITKNDDNNVGYD